MTRLMCISGAASVFVVSITETSVLEDDLGELARLLINAIGRHVLVEFEVGEALEDLLQSRLTDGVVLKLVLLLELLDQLEKESN